ncbi:hypothetical protein M0805_003162 [Coniferiporia weirii]|nr:hypothetical protein M0805_003162 [Coniferiporia weirii]
MSELTANPSSSTDYTKLTVPQLKVLCRDRKFTNYSKLGKAALIEKLFRHAGIVPSTEKTVPQQRAKDSSSEQLRRRSFGQSPSLSNFPSSNQVLAANAHSTPANRPALTTSVSTAKCALTDNHLHEASISNGVPNPKSSHLPIAGQTNLVSTPPLANGTSQPPSGQLAGTKRANANGPSLAHTLNKTKKKKLGDEALKGTKENVASVVHSANALTKTVSKTPLHKPRAFPLTADNNSLNSKEKHIIPSADALKTPNTYDPSTLSSSANGLSSANRFRPLLPGPRENRSKPACTNTGSCTTTAHLAYLDFQPFPPVSLQPITLPPSLSQRKRIRIWSVVLCGLSNRERRQCVLVSRAFRYAVYLSAIPIISREFGGQRFARLSQQLNMSMINFWPYLRSLRLERDNRKKAYEASLLSHFFGNWRPVRERIWGSPDHEMQLVIALRFLMTRVWFTLSLNMRDCERVKRTTVLDAKEVVKDEIWSITVETYVSTSRTTRETFHVLEPTCEVIGLSISQKKPIEFGASNPADASKPPSIRVDWSDYVSYRLLPTGSHPVPPPSLLSHLRWTNAEEYYRGISKLWLTRIANEGEVGEYKKKIAERYVVACVVGNSVSGRWMSANHMAQVIAGTASSDPLITSARKVETPKVNLFLPAHHLVESLHFTTGKGQALHPALAVVQTPDREYFILRDNGMEVGCEEDGVWPVWTELLGCSEDHPIMYMRIRMFFRFTCHGSTDMRAYMMAINQTQFMELYLRSLTPRYSESKLNWNLSGAAALRMSIKSRTANKRAPDDPSLFSKVRLVKRGVMKPAGIPSLLSLILLFFVTTICHYPVQANPSPDGIGDIPAEILNLLLSIGVQVTQFNISLSVTSLLLNTATLEFEGKYTTIFLATGTFIVNIYDSLAASPLPLIELTIDQASAQLGTNGTTFFSFNQTFTDFVIPGLSSANSGTIPNVALTQGALETLNVLSVDELDIISAEYSLRVLTVNGTGGLPLTLPASEIDVPTTLDFQCP